MRILRKLVPIKKAFQNWKAFSKREKRFFSLAYFISAGAVAGVPGAAGVVVAGSIAGVDMLFMLVVSTTAGAAGSTITGAGVTIVVSPSTTVFSSVLVSQEVANIPIVRARMESLAIFMMLIGFKLVGILFIPKWKKGNPPF
jgi:hypothetical protein